MWSLVEEPVGGRLGEGQRCERIHDEVDPKQLDGVERGAEAEHRCGESRHECDHVDGQLELQELSQVLEDTPSPTDGRHRRHEVVVDDHHVGRLAGDLGSAAHGKPDIGLLEGRGVVNAVTGHPDDLAALLEDADETLLVLGKCPGQCLETAGGKLGVDLVVVEVTEGRRVHHVTEVADDAGLAPDLASGLDDVAGDHHDLDTARRQFATAPGTSGRIGSARMNSASNTNSASASSRVCDGRPVPVAVASVR